MALTLSELNAVTDRYFDKTTYDIYFDGNVLLYKLLPVGTKVDGGKSLSVFLEYTNANTGAYGNSTNIPTSRKEIFNRADFRWAGAYASNSIDLEDKRQNSGDAAKVRLIVSKIKNMQKTVRDTLGDDIYSSASTSDNVLGLGDLFNTTTSTAYGNIKEDDMATWAANNSSGFSGALLFADLQTLRRTATINDNKDGVPNLYITSRINKDQFENSLQTTARYTDHNLAKAGFDNILFGGAPVVGDSKQAAGTCDALNLAYLEIMSHKDYFFTKPVWEHEVGTPDAETANIRWVGNLVCKNRAAHARGTGFTAS